MCVWGGGRAGTPCRLLRGGREQYRGAAPLEHTLLNGDEVSGVSVIELDPERFDAGRILLQQSVEVSPTATYPRYCVERAVWANS